MKNYGIYKVAAATPALRVLDVAYNEAQIADLIAKAEEAKTDVLVFPELCLTGYTAGDMLLQDTLLVAVERALLRLASCVGEMLVFVGAPLKKGGKVFNSAVAMANGRILGAVPKSYLPDYSSFCESRWFARGEASGEITLAGEVLPFGTDLLFEAENFPELKAAAEIGADLWATVSPSCFHAMAGATLICCPSADSESVNGAYLRKKLVLAQASRAICGYVYANAGEDESTTDAVYSGHNVIAEKGTLIAESEKFTKGITFGEVDIQKILYERRRRDTFAQSEEGYRTVCFTLRTESARLTRGFSKLPFVPSRNLHEQAESILSLQAHGLKKRLAHVRAKTAVIGVSGGLDSTLALLIVARAFDLLGKDRRDIVGVTMPGFGTSSRTKSQAERLMEALGCTVRKIPIADAVMQHFKDISHDPTVTDITYENAQARERTQILMDIANQTGGIVVGTGDLSELALGFATYNGDHMSMYGVNAGVPKTLMKTLTRCEGERLGGEAKRVIEDVLHTAVSPELLPTKNGEIAQKTEDTVGPYELHDFFLYHTLKNGASPKKLLYLAEHAFFGEYSRARIKEVLAVFIRRFFGQQFKRNCLPDGVKIGSVSLSPRGEFKMPSDALCALWLSEIEG